LEAVVVCVVWGAGVYHGESTTLPSRPWSVPQIHAVADTPQIRILFRIAEFAGGVTPSNPVPFHEQYTYALDCFPMMLALLILAVWHPGRYLVGPASEFPRLSRREKKERKREAKAAVREEKEARRQAKREAKEGRREVGESGDDVV